MFDGYTYESDKDEERLKTQLRRVFAVMADGREHLLEELAALTGGSEAAVSARLRDFRKERFGGWTVKRRRIDRGLFGYTLCTRPPEVANGTVHTDNPPDAYPGKETDMPIKMNKPSESSFGINVEDRFDPRDDHVVELADMEEFNGVSKIDGKPFTSIVWKFAVYDADGVAFTNVIDGGVFESWQFSSLSLAPKSNGRAWASALLGKTELSDAECDKLADNFDTALVGKQATASWKVEDVNGNKRLKLVLLRPLRRKAAPAATPPKATSAPKAPYNGNAQSGETAAERRARLQAELAAVDAEGMGDEAPF